MSLQISTTPALIGLRTTPGELSIRQRPADLQIQNQLPRVEIENTHTQVQIDQTQPFSESGLKPVLEWAYDATQRARQAVETYTGTTTDQGNQMANIQSGVDVVAETADDNAFGQFAVDYNVQSMPRSKPDIRFTEGRADIQVIEGASQVTVTPNPAEIQYRQAAVEAYLRQKNSITITATMDTEI